MILSLKFSSYFKIVFLLMLFCFNLYSQDGYYKSYTKVGVFGNFDYNYINSNFSGLSGIPSCCPVYDFGSGYGFDLGMNFHYQFIKNVGVKMNVSYSNIKFNFTQNENVMITSNSTPYNAVIEHNLDFSMNAINIAPMINYSIFHFLEVNLGMQFAFLSNLNFSQKEMLIKPETFGTFENNKRVRNEYSGEIKQVNNLLYSICASINYDFPLEDTRTFFLSPEISYSYSLVSLIKTDNLRINQIKFGLSFKIRSSEELSNPLEYN